MRNKGILAALLGAALLLTACGTVQAPAPDGEEEEEMTDKISGEFGQDDYRQLADPSMALSRQLLERVEADDDGNVFVSPVSLLAALSMLQNGADGETRAGILAAMQASGLDEDSLNRANASLLDRLQNNDSFTLTMANSVWVNDGFTLQQPFKDVLSSYYLAASEEIDAGDDASADRMNDWVKRQTNGKIEEIVQAPLSGDLVLYLLNAVYFKAPWKYPFLESATEEGAFRLSDGSRADVPIMNLQEELPYRETDQFQAVSLPYGEDGRMRMDVYVPKEGTAAEDFPAFLTAEQRNGWQDAKTRPGTVLLPKFSLSYEVELNEVLSAIGMQRAFGSDAELGRLVEEEKDKLYVSSVLQKTYLSVDEAGTEAVAVTSTSVDVTSAPLAEPFTLKADRPFTIEIRDRDSGLVLFAGKIGNPVQEK
ncbi:serpin family protein [Sporosarcina koreensis]|uniref:serpin family protein n=1 Tax=Sporosarcina koreensis TaxID=334735 RepID=UPI0006943B26|nr:serpin family protein [Sporosarcina koreensis]